jgi:flagellar hook-associated protein 1 FlgK
MDLFNVIMNVGSSLGVYRNKVATASHNIANANTPGYARQEAVLTETLPAEAAGTNGYIGRGVALQAVVQARDQFLETQISAGFSKSGSSTAQADALATVSALDPQGKGGITDALGSFYSSLRDLNQDPGDQGLRRAVVDNAQSVTRAFNLTADGLSSARNAIDQNVTTLVDKVNALMTSVADLNQRISLAVNSGRTPNDLLDVRQNALDELAKMIGARPVPDSYGSVNVVLAGGTCLVSGIVASKLSVQADTDNRGHLDVTFHPVDGSKPVVLMASEMGGQIDGLLSARDESLGVAEANLDALAYDFATAVNTQHQAGYALDGSTGNNLFAPLSSSLGAATDLKVDPAVRANSSLVSAAASAIMDPGDLTIHNPGDSTNLQAIIKTEKLKLSNGLNVQEGIAQLTSDYGIAVNMAESNAEFDRNLMADLSNARQSASGVSIDDELIQLTAAQTSYNALTKVITCTNEMLDALLKIV